MCTFLLVEGVSPTALTHLSAIAWQKGPDRQSCGFHDSTGSIPGGLPSWYTLQLPDDELVRLRGLSGQSPTQRFEVGVSPSAPRSRPHKSRGERLPMGLQ